MNIREIEKIIDNYHLKHSFFYGSKEQLIYEALTTFEDLCLLSVYSSILNPLSLHQIVDHMDSLNQMLLWIEQSEIPSTDKQIETDISEERYKQCVSIMTEYAYPYSRVCSGYISFSRKRLDAKVDGNTVTFTSIEGSNNSTWNDIIREINESNPTTVMSEFNPINIIKANSEILNRSSIQDGYLCYEITSETLDPFLEIAEKQWNITKTLPDSWKFDYFSLEQYKNVWVAITALCYIHFSSCAKIKDPLIRLKNALINVPFDAFTKAISKLCGVDVATVKIIVDYISFDPRKKNVDIMYQPITKIHNKTMLIAPILFMGSRPERNLLAVVSSKSDYEHSKEVNALEDLMVQEIEEILPVNDNIIVAKHKKLEGRLPDIDFGIYDILTNSVLLCELKWFMAADSSKEVYAREDDITHGCEQSDSIMTYAMTNKENFMKQVFGVNDYESIDFFCCVVAKHNIRTRNKYVPVIDINKLKHLIRTKPLNSVFHIIRNHEYEDSLPNNAEITYQSVNYGGFTFNIPAIGFEGEIQEVNFPFE